MSTCRWIAGYWAPANPVLWILVWQHVGTVAVMGRAMPSNHTGKPAPFPPNISNDRSPRQTYSRHIGRVGVAYGPQGVRIWGGSRQFFLGRVLASHCEPLSDLG